MKLHFYTQHLMRKKRALEKLLLKWYDLYHVIERVGSLAYKLDLSTEALVHATFHVSQLKLAYGVMNLATPLPKEFTRGNARIPEAIMEKNMVKRWC